AGHEPAARGRNRVDDPGRRRQAVDLQADAVAGRLLDVASVVGAPEDDRVLALGAEGEGAGVGLRGSVVDTVGSGGDAGERVNTGQRDLDGARVPAARQRV